MNSLGERLVDFVHALRTAGVRISVAESIDALDAVSATGLERARMREALCAALVKDEADRPVFDRTFSGFFASETNERGHPQGRAGGERSRLGGRGDTHGESGKPEPTSRRQKSAPTAIPHPHAERPDRTAEHRDLSAVRASDDRHAEEKNVQERQHQGASGERTGAGRTDVETLPAFQAARLARMREVRLKPFADYSALDYEEARDLLKLLRRRFRIRLGRRMRFATRGRLDFRRTIRAAIQRGGTPVELRFRSRRPRHIDLVLLADVSGSIRYASRLMLELMAGAREFFHRVRSFVFIDRIAEADFEHGHLVMEPALDLNARSDFGRVLVELWQDRQDLFGRSTVVVIMGDGRNNRRPARTDTLSAIGRRCRAVVWLNPEAPERWGTGDSAIRQYERAVTGLLPARDLDELERALLGSL